MTDLETFLLLLIRTAGLPIPEPQYRIPPRKYRYDFAWPEAKLLVEVQGGIWMDKSGHNTGYGLHRDYEKVNYASLNGWKILQVDKQMIEDGTAIRLIEEALERK